MAVSLRRRWAATAPVPVFVARGGGSGTQTAELAADPRVRLVVSPRHASVLLAAGRFPGAMGAALDRVHDQVPRPRSAVWWTADVGGERPAALRDVTVVTGLDVVAALVDAHRRAFLEGAGDADVLPDAPPNPFHGRGDHGQGGEGMMGGVPYGRPMAMTGDDRDGLALDQSTVELGPFLPGFPNGLRVEATLQGGVVQRARVTVLDLGSGADLGAPDNDAPARRELRWLADALALGGLPALAARAARIARAGGGAGAREALVRRVRRSGLPATWAGIGRLDGADARDRLERHLATGLGEEIHVDVAPGDVAALLVGQDWGDALVTICSLNLATDRLVAVTEVIS